MFYKDDDVAAFVNLMREAHEKVPTRLTGIYLLANHFHHEPAMRFEMPAVTVCTRTDYRKAIRDPRMHRQEFAETQALHVGGDRHTRPTHLGRSVRLQIVCFKLARAAMQEQ